MDNETENKLQWYAIRVTYSRELAVKDYLDDHGIENYVPMHLAERTVAGRKRKVREPIIHNLIFIRAAACLMRSLKAETPLPICYIMDRAARVPLVVPDWQMEDFMRVITAQDGKVELIEAQTVDFACGDLVRVTEGPFAGVEGRYIRHKGHYKVAVEIQGIATALTAYIPSRSVEKIKAEQTARLRIAFNS